MAGDATPVSVELSVRSLASDGTRPATESPVERLERLDTVDIIDGLSVHVTGKKGRPDGPTARTDPGAFLLDSVAAFEAWADRTGRPVSGAFRRVEGARDIDGSDHSGVSFPTMGLAEYEGGEFRFVSPASEGSTVHTVPDRLDVLVERTVNAASDGTGEPVDSPGITRHNR